MKIDFVQSLSTEYDYVFAATSVSKDTPQSEHVYITQCSSCCIAKCQFKIQGQSVEMIVIRAHLRTSSNLPHSRDYEKNHRCSDTPLPLIGIENLDLQYNGAY